LEEKYAFYVTLFGYFRRNISYLTLTSNHILGLYKPRAYFSGWRYVHFLQKLRKFFPTTKYKSERSTGLGIV